MLRNRIFIAALALAAGMFFVSTSAQAQVVYAPQPQSVVVPFCNPPVVVPPPPVVIEPWHHHHYKVIYRANCRQPWLTYREYHSMAFAQDVAGQIRRQGFEVAIVR
jgi:hypothetical protein